MIAAPLLAAPLADQVFKPAMSAGGVLEPLLGPILGTGPSRGIGLLVIVLGLTAAAVSFLAFGNRAIRNVESDLPDHVALKEPITTPAVGALDN